VTFPVISVRISSNPIISLMLSLLRTMVTLHLNTK